jgi:ferric-dicitrate binding protein FerR (iron transport regulator)
MEQKDQHDYYSNLISRYLSGNTDAAEQKELEQWVLADPANKKQFIAFKKAWMLSGMQEPQDTQVEAIWQRTSEELFPTAKVRKLPAHRSSNRWLKIAATVVVLIVSAALVYRHFQTPQPFFAATTTVTMPYDLSDGSRVTLNKSSSIRFLPKNENGEREVQLTGDAFFDVARDETAPFVIETQNVEIEVLGTSFYVDSRASQSAIQVIVQSGKVAVRAGNQEVILNKDEQAIFQKEENQLLKQTNQDENYLALKSGELVFKDTPLEAAVFALSRQFNTNIKIADEALRACSITSTFKNKSLAAVLTILESSFGIQSVQQGDEVVLTGSCSRD